MNQARTYRINDPAAIAAKVKAAGGPAIDLGEATGQASADGITLQWAVGRGQITVTVLSKPWMISYGAIWSHVDAVMGDEAVAG